MRLLPRFILPLLILMLVISYQNFSNTDSSAWDSTNTLKIMQEMNNFNNQDSNKPILATPQNGSDLNSVSNDWLSRQGRLLLNGYDKKLEASLNDKLNSWVHDLTKDEPEDGLLTGSEQTAEPGEAQNGETHNKRKQSFRFTRVNALQYGIGEGSYFDFIADPGNTRLNYSQIVSSNSKLGLEHRTSDNKTQMYFKYEW